MSIGDVERFLRELHAVAGERSAAALDLMLNTIPAHELAALGFDWPAWARPKQLPPATDWRSWGLCCGRGFGKTMAVVGHAVQEIEAGRAMRVALVGQNAPKTVEILVTGETGLLEMSPPWLGAQWEPSTHRVLFANGACATVYSAEAPSGLRGPQHHLGIATEVAAWPASTRDESLDNLMLGLRLGYGRLLWDSTPRARNPLIRLLLQRAQESPTKHVVVNGSTRENALNLTADVVGEWEAAWGGTARGAEELEGRFFDDAEGALFMSAWIERARRGWPETLRRRILSIDPAITSDPRSSDATGIVDMGLGVDGQVYALRNMTGVHRAEVWPGLAIDTYLAGSCDVIVLETNRGGNAWAALLRGAAQARGLTLIELGPDERPGHRKDVVYLRPFSARGTKAVRASAAAALVERGRVSFVAGALGDLEDRLCSFTGEAGEIDDCVDAFVAGCHELANLAGHEKRPPNVVATLRLSEAMMPGAVANAARDLQVQQSVAQGRAKSGSWSNMPRGGVLAPWGHRKHRF